MIDFDVFIAGAGPAGCATALSLSRFAPELRIGLAGTAPEDEPRVGESVPPLVRPFLEQIGVWEAFLEAGHVEAYRTHASWGEVAPASNEFLAFTWNVGWHLDRAEFDALLVREARRRVAHLAGQRVTQARFDGSRWQISCGAQASPYGARVIVDATGRAATLCRQVGAKPVRGDALVGCYARFDGCADDGDGLLIESCPDGWWYTCALPRGERVVVCMSDADIIRERSLHRPRGWTRRLLRTRFVSASVAGAAPPARLHVRPAGSQSAAAGLPLTLVPVGDAASCFDPISSQGITKALRSGIFASYAIADWLRRGDARGLQRYASFVSREFDTYRRVLARYYRLERRWPRQPFWERRHALRPFPSEWRGRTARTDS